MAGGEIVPIVSHKRGIGTNRIPSARRFNSCSVKETGDSEGSAEGETKPDIDLIIVDSLYLVGSIWGDIQALNVTENANELPGVLAVLYLPTGSFAELL